MYDWPAERATTDALWARLRDALRAEGFDAPDAVTRGGDLWSLWRHPDLLLGQTCGLPYSLELNEETHLVGAPDPGLEGCPPGHYRSLIVARADDPREAGELLAARVAVNEPVSQSGWGALAFWAQKQGLALSGEVRLTGSHHGSAGEIAGQRADIAALDAATWRLIERHMPGVAARLRVVAETVPTPALPFITARRFDAGRVASAVATALGPRFVRFRPKDYLSVPRLPFPEAA